MLASGRSTRSESVNVAMGPWNANHISISGEGIRAAKQILTFGVTILQQLGTCKGGRLSRSYIGSIVVRLEDCFEPDGAACEWEEDLQMICKAD